MFRAGAREIDDLARLGGAACGFAHTRCHFVESGRGLFQACGLLFGAVGKVSGSRRHFAAAGMDRIGARLNHANGRFKLFNCCVEASAQILEFGIEGLIEPHGQIAVGELHQRTRHRIDNHARLSFRLGNRAEGVAFCLNPVGGGL